MMTFFPSSLRSLATTVPTWLVPPVTRKAIAVPLVRGLDLDVIMGGGI
jgi:hypothetical protein